MSSFIILWNAPYPSLPSLVRTHSLWALSWKLQSVKQMKANSVSSNLSDLPLSSLPLHPPFLKRNSFCQSSCQRETMRLSFRENTAIWDVWTPESQCQCSNSPFPECGFLGAVHEDSYPQSDLPHTDRTHWPPDKQRSPPKCLPGQLYKHTDIINSMFPTTILLKLI